jgi:hypothetical protein
VVLMLALTFMVTAVAVTLLVLVMADCKLMLSRLLLKVMAPTVPMAPTAPEKVREPVPYIPPALATTLVALSTVPPKRT